MNSFGLCKVFHYNYNTTDTISQDTILIERLVSVAYASTRVVVLIERLVSVAYASTRVVVLIECLVYVAYASARIVVYLFSAKNK